MTAEVEIAPILAEEFEELLPMIAAYQRFYEVEEIDETRNRSFFRRFLAPSEDAAGTSYQINQSLISVGAGGKTGRGDEATQTRDGFLPERHTDFIFAVVGERYGFMGAAFILSLYALLIWRALRIMTLSKNRYGTIIAGTVAVNVI